MKATKTEIEKSVIQELENGPWPAPRKFDNEPALYTEFTGQMIEDIHDHEFTAAGLKAGMKIFRIEFPYNTRWPSLNELLVFLRKGNSAVCKPEQVEEQSTGWSKEAWVDHVMRTPAGQKAVADGLALAVVAFAEENVGRELDADAMQELLASEKRFRETIARLTASTSPLDFSHLKIGKGMIERRAELERRYLGREVTREAV